MDLHDAVNYSDDNSCIFKTAICIQTFTIQARDMLRMVYLEDKRQLIITDYRDKSLKFVNFDDGSYIESLKPLNEITKEPLLKAPYSICISKSNEIFINDDELRRIFVFEIKNFKLLRQISLKEIISEYQMINYMLHEDFDDEYPCRLYLSSHAAGKIFIIDSLNGTLLNYVALDRPYFLKIFKEKLYTTSAVGYSLKYNQNKTLIKIEYGSNCLFILNKKTLEIEKKIKYNFWLKPMGLHVEQENERIWTMAYKIDQNSVISDSLYLFISNQQGVLLNEISFNPSFGAFMDFQLIESKLIFCAINWVKVFQLE